MIFFVFAVCALFFLFGHRNRLLPSSHPPTRTRTGGKARLLLLAASFFFSFFFFDVEAKNLHIPISGASDLASMCNECPRSLKPLQGSTHPPCAFDVTSEPHATRRLAGLALRSRPAVMDGKNARMMSGRPLLGQVRDGRAGFTGSLVRGMTHLAVDLGSTRSRPSPARKTSKHDVLT